MATVLLTGFGRFHGAPVNPSGLLACKLARVRRPAFADTKRVAHVFATSYAAVDRQLSALIAHNQPDAIVMFGLASRTRHIRIEVQARNRMLVLFPDAAGFSPRARAIHAHGPARLSGRAPFSRLLAVARGHGSAVALSRNAGAYVCNYCYWRAIEGAPHTPVVVFIHVPKVRSARPRTPKRPRAPRFANLVKAGEAILAAIIAGGLAAR
jgi:pyroglutamyl-peptidase